VKAWVLTSAAETDVREIFDYTVDQWGPDQADSYHDNLEAHFQRLASGVVRKKPVALIGTSDSLKGIFVSHCQHHYVFHTTQPGDRILILAVFHESMDLMERLRERLKEG